MVRTPQKSILQLNGKDDIYHIEIEPETSTKTLASTEGLDGFEVEYTCPNCLERNSSRFTNFPETVSVLCSSCQKTHQIYDFSDETLVVITRKIEGLLTGVRNLCGKAQLREACAEGDLLVLHLAIISISRSVIHWLRAILGGLGFFIALSSLYIPEMNPYGLIVGAILITVSLLKKDIVQKVQEYLTLKLAKWVTNQSGYLISTDVLGREYSKGIVYWKLTS